MSIIIGVIEEGLIYAIMALGLYIMVESYCRCIYSSLTEAILLSGTFFIFIKLL